MDIMTFIRANRGYSLSKSLKQSNLTGATASAAAAPGTPALT